jgi:two-component system, NarL family, nitrate/nitrite response regulator NarL
VDRIKDSIRVVVAIETRIYREGIAQLLDNYSDIEVVAATSNLAETFGICLKNLPHILLVDATFPETLPTIRKLKQKECNIKVILLSMRACRDQISTFAGDGVLGFVTRDDSIDDLRQAINAAMKSGFWCSCNVAKLLLEPQSQTYDVQDRFSDLPLTRQQVNVLQMLESGISNKEIARKLHIETATVKNHVHHILQKLNVNSRGEAAAFYRRLSNNYSIA